MSIKDNFSQAVKELWKKDGQDEQPDVGAKQPTELDQYLQQGGQNIQQGAQQGVQQGVQQSVQQGVQPVDQQMGQMNPQMGQTAPQMGQTMGQTAPQQPVQQPNPQMGQQPVQTPQQPVQPTPDVNAAGVPLETPYYRNPAPQQTAPTNGYGAPNGYTGGGYGGQPPMGGYNANSGFGGGYPPAQGNGQGANAPQTDEITVISKNTIIDGNVRSLANMQIDGSIKGNIETTRDIDMTGKVVGDVTCNNAGMTSAAMQGNVSLKGRMRMDRDTILIGDLTSQYADINGRVRGKLDIAGKAELKRDAIIFGDINASTIAVTDGAIIQGYVNTTFLSKDDSRNVFPDAISLDTTKDNKPNGTT